MGLERGHNNLRWLGAATKPGFPVFQGFLTPTTTTKDFSLLTPSSLQQTTRKARPDPKILLVLYFSATIPNDGNTTKNHKIGISLGCFLFAMDSCLPSPPPLAGVNKQQGNLNLFPPKNEITQCSGWFPLEGFLSPTPHC